MGKDKVIKTIAKLIAGLTAHKILASHANKKESIYYLESEIDNYRGNVLKEITEYNWNSYDIDKIKTESLKFLEKELEEKHFQGIIFSEKEKIDIFDKTFKEFFA